MLGRVLLTSVCVLLSCGCTAPGHFGRGYVACALSERAGLELGSEACACEPAVPDIVDPSDGISEDEAVILGLWNNAAFQLLLADLNITRADLIQANQIGNPEIWTMFPVGVKAFEFALRVPLETIWLRPKRVAIAEVESQRVGDRLVQDALNVIRDVRVAYADLVLAHDRLRLAEEGARLRGRIGELAEARLRAGDASELEVSAARIDARRAQEEAARLVGDIDVARQRLQFLLGVGVIDLPIDPVVPPDVPEHNFAADDLVHEALATRPDLLAAELAIAAAQRRARLARFDYIPFLGFLPDINSPGAKGFEAGPGMQVTIPVFNQNQGARARAQAEVQRLQRQYVALRDTIVLEVRQAHTRYVQAADDLRTWNEQILPESAAAVTKAERSYQHGGDTLLLVLETNRQLLASRLRALEVTADLRRTHAELERSVGRRLDNEHDARASAEEVQPPQPEPVLIDPDKLP